ncbi:AAA family ATPase [Mycolicibacterium elephantis]
MTIRHKPGVGLHDSSAEWQETIANVDLFGGDGETASGPVGAEENGSGPVTPPGGDDTATARAGGRNGRVMGGADEADLQAAEILIVRRSAERERIAKQIRDGTINPDWLLRKVYNDGSFNPFEDDPRNHPDFWDRLTDRLVRDAVNEKAKSLEAQRLRGGDSLTLSWAPVDMAEALCCDDNDDAPTVLARDDGPCLLYPGKVHSTHGESESGKTWAALIAAAQVLNTGGSVLFIDFEDGAKGVGGRLLALGVRPSVLADQSRFVYVRPDCSPTANASSLAAFDALLARQFGLAIIDGVTEAMTIYGLSGRDGDDIARWQQQLPRQVARRTGAAVVCIDHVTKDPDTRGRHAIGGVHKLNGLDGAAYTFEAKEPFARGKVGVTHIRVGKDRPGHVRAVSGRVRKGDQTQLTAILRLDATDPEIITWSLTYKDAEQRDGDESEAKADGGFRPTWFMEQVSRYWEETEEETERSDTKTVNKMCEERKKAGKPQKRNLWRLAIDILVEDGYAEFKLGDRRSHIHSVVKPYRMAEDPKSDGYLGGDPAENHVFTVNVTDSEGDGNDG